MEWHLQKITDIHTYNHHLHVNVKPLFSEPVVLLVLFFWVSPMRGFQFTILHLLCMNQHTLLHFLLGTAMHTTAYDCRMVRIAYGAAFVTVYLVITCSEEALPPKVVVFPLWTHIATSCCNRKISAFISDLLPLCPGRQWTASTCCHSVQVSHPVITSLHSFIKEACLGIFYNTSHYKRSKRNVFI